MIARRSAYLVSTAVCLGLMACSGGAKEESPSEPAVAAVQGQVTDQASGQIPVQDKLKTYSLKVGRDPAELEKIFNEKLGAAPSNTFNEAWFNFFKATDPALAEMDFFLPQSYGRVFLVYALGGAEAVTTVRSTGETGGENWAASASLDGSWEARLVETSWEAHVDANGNWVSSTNNGGEKNLIESSDPEKKDKAKAAIAGFNSLLLLVQSRLIEDAAVFNLNSVAVLPGAFPVPEKFFGSFGALDAELKDLISRLLYSASVKTDEGFFSFFKFSSDAPAGESVRRRYLSANFGKFTWVNALDNFLASHRQPVTE